MRLSKTSSNDFPNPQSAAGSAKHNRDFNTTLSKTNNMLKKVLSSFTIEGCGFINACVLRSYTLEIALLQVVSPRVFFYASVLTEGAPRQFFLLTVEIYFACSKDITEIGLKHKFFYA